MASDDGERNLDPSDARKEEFRKQGRFAKARDLAGVASLGAVVLVLSGERDTLSDSFKTLFHSTIGDLGALERTGISSVIRNAGMHLLTVTGAAVGAAILAAIVMSLVQTRGQVFTELAMPNFERLNPINSLTNLFDFKRKAMETGVAVLRIAVVGAAAWHELSRDLPMLASMSRMPLNAALPAIAAAVGHTAITAAAALFCVAAVDFGQSYMTLSKQMKMTRKEQEDEHKSSEGDTKQKHKLRAKGRAMIKKAQAKRALNLASVKGADVIVTNPTHVAVALRYGPKDPAPVVLAKGHDEEALRIRAEARKYGIPIMENRRLARALDAEVQIGRPVPASHFAAVARVLAFVYKLKKKNVTRS